MLPPKGKNIKALCGSQKKKKSEGHRLKRCLRDLTALIRTTCTYRLPSFRWHSFERRSLGSPRCLLGVPFQVGSVCENLYEMSGETAFVFKELQSDHRDKKDVFPKNYYMLLSTAKATIITAIY